MGTISQAKTYGGVGSILVILTATPVIGALLGIVGFILILLAVKYISDDVNDRSIFQNMLISAILAIVGVVVAGLVIIGSVFRFVGLNNLAGGQDLMQFNPSAVPPGNWVALVGSVITALALLWVVLIVSAVFLRRAYDSIAENLKVDMFRTAALVYLIGAATTIILVGFLLLFVAQILQIVAFFSIEERRNGAPGPQPGPT